MHRHFQHRHPLQRIRIVFVEIDQNEQPSMRRHDAKKLGQRAFLIGIVIKRLHREHLVKKVFFPGNLRRGSDHEHHVVEFFRSGSRLPDHLVGNVDADHLSKTLWPFADHASQQARRPTRSAAEIQNALTRTQIHAPHRFLGGVEVIALHLRALAVIGPAIEFVLQALVGRLGSIGTHDFSLTAASFGLRATSEPSQLARSSQPSAHSVILRNSSKNVGYDTPAASAPTIVVSPSARNAATANAMAILWSPNESSLAPCRCWPPGIRIPSGSSSTSAPIFRRLAATAAMRSDSFTRNSLASRTSRPLSVYGATAASTGISSISAAVSAPAIAAPLHSAPRASIEPTSSP